MLRKIEFKQKRHRRGLSRKESVYVLIFYLEHRIEVYTALSTVCRRYEINYSTVRQQMDRVYKREGVHEYRGRILLIRRVRLYRNTVLVGDSK